MNIKNIEFMSADFMSCIYLLKRLGCANLFFLFCGLFSPIQILAQQTQNISTGTKESFSYSIQNTFGVTTSASGSSNLEINNEAVLKIKAGSTIQNSVGAKDDSEASIKYIATPTGGNIDLKNIEANNNYIIDEGTSFRSTMKTIANPDPNKSMTGNASASAVQTMTITVDRSSSTFFNSFSSNF